MRSSSAPLLHCDRAGNLLTRQVHRVGGACDPEDIADAGLQISSALHYIHVKWDKKHPVLHRDVTPKNVFYFDSDVLFKLGDFGISRSCPARTT